MIRSLSKKKGGTRALNKDSLDFQIFSESMKLVDIETNNGLYTCVIDIFGHCNPNHICP